MPLVLLVVVIVSAAFLDFDLLASRVDTVSSLDKLKATKLELWPMFALGAAQVWPLGFGLGAFEIGFGRFQTEQLDVTFTHPENLVLQWLAEIGAPLFVVALLLSSWVFVSLWRGTAGHLSERVALVALLGVLAHELFDFSLELNAVAPAFAIVLGAVAATHEVEARRSVRSTAGVGWACALALALLGLWKGYPTHLRDEEHLSEVARSGAREALADTSLASLDRHPADWVLYATMANDEALRGNPSRALAWVNRVLFLRPADGPSHAVAARALVRLGRSDQALSELKLAWAQGDLRTLPLGLSLAAQRGEWERLLVDRPLVLPEAWRLLQAGGQVAQAGALVDAALEFAPSEAVAREARVLAVRQAAASGQGARALSLLEGGQWSDEEATALLPLRVQVLTSAARADEALSLLRAAQLRHPADVQVAANLVEQLVRVGRGAEALDVIGRLKPLVGTDHGRLEVLLLEASVCEGLEHWGRAIDALQTAARLGPQRAELHYRVASDLERMGSLRSALDAVRKGQGLDTPEGARAKDAWLLRLEGALHERP
jgi:tetratricopeptide (TPR) repeat protein